MRFESIASLVLLLLDFSRASFLPEPNVKWTYTLPEAGSLSGPSLRKDNAVVVSNDGSYLFMTTDNGNLYIVDAASPEDSIRTFEPGNLSDDRFVECRSGVVMVEDTGMAFAIYAVVDRPFLLNVEYDVISEQVTSTVEGEASSRLFAVNVDGSLRWRVDIPGVIAGSPVISFDKERLYVVHNLEDGGGHISIVNGVGSVAPSVLDSVTDPGRAGPFGPPAGSTALIDGVERDVIAVAESWEDGYSEGQGQIFLFRQIATDTFDLSVASEWAFPSVTRPTFTPGATSMWVGGLGSTLAGWSNERDWDRVVQGTRTAIAPEWERSLAPSERNNTQPFLSAPTVSLGGERLYIAGASSDLFCVNALSGRNIWSYSLGSSIHLTEPKLSMPVDDVAEVVYSIEALNGNVRQHDALDGGVNWEFGCSDLTGIAACQDAVEAEFSVSPNGNFLYYGDIFGRIVALEVGSFPTPAPTATVSSAPTTVPSSIPSLSPSMVPSPLFSASPSGVPTADTSHPSLSPSFTSLVTPPPTTMVTTTPPTTSPTSTPTASPTTVPATPPTTLPAELSPTWGTMAPTSDPSAGSTTGSEDPGDDPDSNTQGLVDDSDEPVGMLEIVFAVIAGVFVLLVCAVIFVFCRRRRDKALKDKLILEQEQLRKQMEEEEARDLAYEEECQRTEQETLMEIVGACPTTPTPPSRTRGQNNSSRRKMRGFGRRLRRKSSPKTPSTLDIIEESSIEGSSHADEQEDSSVDNDSSTNPVNTLSPDLTGSGTVKNLEASFANAAISGAVGVVGASAVVSAGSEDAGDGFEVSEAGENKKFEENGISSDVRGVEPVSKQTGLEVVEAPSPPAEQRYVGSLPVTSPHMSPPPDSSQVEIQTEEAMPDSSLVVASPSSAAMAAEGSLVVASPNSAGKATDSATTVESPVTTSLVLYNPAVPEDEMLHSSAVPEDEPGECRIVARPAEPQRRYTTYTLDTYHGHESGAVPAMHQRSDAAVPALRQSSDAAVPALRQSSDAALQHESSLVPHPENESKADRSVSSGSSALYKRESLSPSPSYEPRPPSPSDFMSVLSGDSSLYLEDASNFSGTQEERAMMEAHNIRKRLVSSECSVPDDERSLRSRSARSNPNAPADEGSPPRGRDSVSGDKKSVGGVPQIWSPLGALATKQASPRVERQQLRAKDQEPTGKMNDETDALSRLQSKYRGARDETKTSTHPGEQPTVPPPGKLRADRSAATRDVDTAPTSTAGLRRPSSRSRRQPQAEILSASTRTRRIGASVETESDTSSYKRPGQARARLNQDKLDELRRRSISPDDSDEDEVPYGRRPNQSRAVSLQSGLLKDSRIERATPVASDQFILPLATPGLLGPDDERSSYAMRSNSLPTDTIGIESLKSLQHQDHQERSRSLHAGMTSARRRQRYDVAGTTSSTPGRIAYKPDDTSDVPRTSDRFTPRYVTDSPDLTQTRTSRRKRSSRVKQRPQTSVLDREDDKWSWNKLMTELSKAEKQFFHPDVSKEGQRSSKSSPRSESPPPPPPPSHPPPAETKPRQVQL